MPTPATSSTGSPAAPLAAAKIAAHEAIVAGLEAVAATDVANARRGEATSPARGLGRCAVRIASRSVRAPEHEQDGGAERARTPSAARRSRAATPPRPLRPPRRRASTSAMPAPIASPTRQPARSVERTRNSDIGPSCSATRNPSPNPTVRACMAAGYPRHCTPARRSGRRPLESWPSTESTARSSGSSVRTGACPGATSAPRSASAPTPRPTACGACAAAGVITGFVALVDPAAGGRRLEALVGVTLRRGVDSDAFAVAACAPRRASVEVLHLSGAPDYQLRRRLPRHRRARRPPAHPAQPVRRRRHRDDDRACAPGPP